MFKNKGKKILLYLIIISLFAFTVQSTLEDDIAGYYKFDGTSGAVIDSTGNNNMTASPSPTRNITGLINKAFDYNYNNDYVITNALTTGVNFTWSLWMNTSGRHYDGDCNYWIHSGLGADITYMRSHSSVSGGDMTIAFANSEKVAINYSYFNDSTWHHVVAVANNTAGRIFIDGNLNWSGAITAGNMDTVTAIGSHVTSGLCVVPNGIDEVGIWNRSLLDGEVLDIYNSGAGLNYPFISATTLTTGLYNETYHNISLLIDEGEEIRAWASYNFTLNNSEVYPNGYCNFSADIILQEKYFKNTTNITVCAAGCDYTNRTYEVTGLDTEGYIKDYLRFDLCRSDAQTNKNYVVSTSCGYTETFSYNTIELCSLGSTNLFINTTDCGGAVTDVNVSIWTTGLPNTRNIVLVNSSIGMDREHNHTQVLVWNNTFKTFFGDEIEYYEHGEHEQTINCYGNNSLIQNKTITYNVTAVNKPPTIFVDIIGYNKSVFPFINNTIAYRVGDWLNITGGCQDDDLANYGMNLSFTNGTVIDSVTFAASKNMIPLSVNYTITNFSVLDAYLDGSSSYKSYFYCNDTSNNVSSVTKHFTMINNKPVVTWTNSSPVNMGVIPTVINWSVTDFEGETPTCYLLQNGTLNASASNTGHSVSVVPGSYNFTVRCADSLRNSTDKTLIFVYTEGCLISILKIYDSARYDSLNQNVNINCTNAIVPDSCHYSINAYANMSVTNCSNFNVSLHRGSNELVFSTVNGAVINLKSITVYGFDKDASVFTYTYLFVLIGLLIAVLIAGAIFKVPILGVLVMVLGGLIGVQLAMFSLWATVIIMVLGFVAGLTMIFK